MERINRGKELTKVVLEYGDGSKEELAQCVILENLQDGFKLVPYNMHGVELAELMFRVVISHLLGGDEDED